MSEEAEFWNDLKEIKRDKKRDNTASSTALLQRLGALFESKNNGAHLVVQSGHNVVDFWPSTGLWIVRGEKTKRRGVRKLEAFIRKNWGES